MERGGGEEGRKKDECTDVSPSHFYSSTNACIPALLTTDLIPHTHTKALCDGLSRHTLIIALTHTGTESQTGAGRCYELAAAE